VVACPPIAGKQTVRVTSVNGSIDGACTRMREASLLCGHVVAAIVAAEHGIARLGCGQRTRYGISLYGILP
jgi:hypothetical protein